MNSKNINDFMAVKIASDIMKALTVCRLGMPQVFPFSTLTDMSIAVITLAAHACKEPEIRVKVYTKLNEYGPGVLDLWLQVMEKSLALVDNADFAMWDKDVKDLSESSQVIKNVMSKSM